MHPDQIRSLGLNALADTLADTLADALIDPTMRAKQRRAKQLQGFLDSDLGVIREITESVAGLAEVETDARSGGVPVNEAIAMVAASSESLGISKLAMTLAIAVHVHAALIAEIAGIRDAAREQGAHDVADQLTFALAKAAGGGPR